MNRRKYPALPLCKCGKPIKVIHECSGHGLLYALSTVEESYAYYQGSCGNGCAPVAVDMEFHDRRELEKAGVEFLAG